MKFEEYKTSLSNSSPPVEISDLLKALWYEAKGEWDKSHDVVNDISSENGSWIHAYLHRVEGDMSNASYWYNRAGKPMSKKSLKQEWEDLVKGFL